MRIALSKMKTGQSGRIAGVDAPAGALRRRLYDMGATKGASVKFVKAAPLGDPIEIIIRGYSLSLRKNEAQNLVIEIDEAAETPAEKKSGEKTAVAAI